MHQAQLVQLFENRFYDCFYMHAVMHGHHCTWTVS